MVMEKIKNNQLCTSEKKPKVSILIAVYNVAPYLRDCILSLKEQTLYNWQAICVNDGSTDKSLDILNLYASEDKRIEVYSNDKNRGIGYTRNVALSHATGEFIMMLDGDDRLSTDALQNAVTIFDNNSQIDIVLFTLRYWNSWKGEIDSDFQLESMSSVITGEEAFSLCLTWKLHGLYIIRSFLHHLYPFDESSYLYSDDNTPRIHFLHARYIAQGDGVYYYRQHNESITHKISVRRFDYLIANYSLKQMLLNENVKTDYINIFEEHRWKNWVMHVRLFLKYYKKFCREDRILIMHIFSQTIHTIDYGRISWKTKKEVGYWPIKSLKIQIFIQYFYLKLHYVYVQIRNLHNLSRKENPTFTPKERPDL